MPGFDENTSNNTKNATTERDEDRRRNRDEVEDARDDIEQTHKSLLSSGGRRFTSSAQNQSLEQVETGLRETLENFHDLKDEIHIVKVGTTSLRYPAVAVCQEFQAKGKKHITYFLYPVQDRNTPLERKGNGNRDSRRDVPPVPTDVIDNKFLSAVESAIRTHFKAGEAVEVTSAGTQILGDLFNLDIKENAKGYQNLIIAAVGQTDAVKYKTTGNPAAIIQAANLDKDSVLIGRLDYSPAINEDLSGNPIRSDINLQIVEQKRRNRGRDGRDDRRNDDSYNGEAGIGQTIIGVDAITNFIFVESDDRRDRNRDDNPQKFMTEIRISNIECRLNPSLANFLYGASQIASVAQNERWVNAHMPNLIRNRPGRDLGGLYAEQPMKDDPNEPQSLADADADEVFDMAHYATQRDVLVTFMAPESSEYSRISDQLFVMANSKLGSDEYLDAFDDMMAEFTIMLGFRPDWSERDPIFVQDQLHRCLIGYYNNGNEVLSSEDIDYLSIVNTGNGLRPLQTAQDWDASYGLPDYDEGTCKRAQIVMEETDGMVKWTGAQNTLSISMPFLNMLKRSFDEAGLGIEVESMEDNSGRRVRRHLSSLRDYAGRADGYGRRRDDRERGGRSRGRGRGRR